MDSSSSSSWAPPPGRHSVNIGSSLGRVIRNRKLKGSQVAAPKRSNLPERDFYSFKFNFRANSIDTTKPASIEIKNRPENNLILAEYPSTQAGEVHVFTGQEQLGKDVDCVLIFDEETGTFTLEKVDSFVNFQSGGKRTVSPRSTSPAPQLASSYSSSSSNKGKGKQVNHDIDRAIDAASRRDDDVGVRTPASIALRREEEEETGRPTNSATLRREEGEEGEESETPLRQVVPMRPPLKAERPTKPLPKALRAEAKPSTNTLPVPPKTKMQQPLSSTTPAGAPPLSSSVVPPPPASKLKSAPSTKTKKPKASLAAAAFSNPRPSPNHPSEEIIEFGRPTKRPRPSTTQQPPPPPPPKEPVALSLPGDVPAFAPPPAPPSSGPSISSSSRAAPLPDPVTVPSPEAAPPEGDSDDDEFWEEVDAPAPEPTPSVPSSQYSSRNDAAEYDISLEQQLEEDIFGDGFADDGYDDADADAGVEIDPNAFAMELAEEMGESEGYVEANEDEDDFLAGAISPVPGDSQQRRPISLNQLASGGVGAPGDSDDDYTSSEESDDD